MTGRRQRSVDGPQRCHYAADPARRPRCTLTATVQFGTLALCRSCNSQRSSIGKGQSPVPLPDTGPVDVLDWIATAHEQATAAEQILTAAITRARQNGQPWSAIGAQLGITRQAAQQRFTRASAHESTKGATRAP